MILYVTLLSMMQSQSPLVNPRPSVMDAAPGLDLVLHAYVRCRMIGLFAAPERCGGQ